MKFIFWIFLIFYTCSNAFSQEFYNFSWSGSGLEWMRVFEVQGSKDSLMSAIIKANALTKYTKVDDSTLIGEITNFKGICDGSDSKSTWATRTAYTNGSINGSAKIEFKQNKYRVTVYGMTIDPKLNFGDDENVKPLESWYWNFSKNDFRTGNYRHEDLICMDNGLKIQFTLKSDKNW